ncbi:MAG: BlaI/MecI/CopY family transcriptional regulator [Deltaproteobacteria bacterium]|nr:BlaI/MecI/CopY family transcriptional regulator [Deltaproteobacteria bacterium]
MTNKRTEKNNSALLTEVELELMSILWKLGGGSVHAVLEKLPVQRKLAYTSVSTILRILEKKGVLRSEKGGRGHIYIPCVTKEKYEAASLRHLVEKVFDGTPASLVRRLLDDGDLGPEELKSIRSLVLGSNR